MSEGAWTVKVVGEEAIRCFDKWDARDTAQEAIFSRNKVVESIRAPDGAEWRDKLIPPTSTGNH